VKAADERGKKRDVKREKMVFMIETKSVES